MKIVHKGSGVENDKGKKRKPGRTRSRLDARLGDDNKSARSTQEQISAKAEKRGKRPDARDRVENREKKNAESARRSIRRQRAEVAETRRLRRETSTADFR
ncbi:MAG: hypothetical protein IJE97_05445 [Thermoguttaceae bacterium]|nr:hypothetical protein [Thermoguttaceae bacterium]MBQ6827864.1 hypothetical protein [Thermoguttaceae bacterium]MBQ7110091.1 hypothetical protein [Thermoguttaceae bacterium]